MSRQTSSTRSTIAKPVLKSPLRTPTIPALTAPEPATGAVTSVAELVRPAAELTPEERRNLQIATFTGWLRTQTSERTKRRFQDGTVNDYAETARALSRWMTEERIEGDFTACDIAVLNRFFAAYRNSHEQGGTNTRQRNLHPLFKWLVSLGHPDPWADDSLVRFGPVKVRPSTLSKDFIHDLLDVTGGGKATGFVDIRDHAILRMLTEGPRREEIAQREVRDLSDDLIARPFVRLVPLKGAREWSQGRLVALSMASARAITAYLQARGSHRWAALPALWLGSRNRGPMTGSGIYQMLDRRAEQAGYDPRLVHPHMYRHTTAHDWLAGGGSEGDLMRLMGWKDRSMVDRYAEDSQQQRALEAKLRRGDMY